MSEVLDAFTQVLPHLTGLLFGLERNGQGGLSLNVLLACTAIPVSVVLGALFCLLRMFAVRPFSWIVAACTKFVLCVPLLLMIFWMHYALPAFLGLHPPLFIAGMSALVVYGAANFAEIFRSGIAAVNRTELEAARLAGMTRRQMATLIILPQVLRTMIPAILSLAVTLFKDSSLVFVVGLIELTQTGMLLANRYPAMLVAFYACIGFGFMSVSLLLTFVAERVRRKMEQKGLGTARI